MCLTLLLTAALGWWVFGRLTSPLTVTTAAAVPVATEDAGAPVRRSEQGYPLPAGLRVQRADGVTLALADALFDGRPVVLTFMYTSCATVCPITNHTLVEFEKALGAQAGSVHTVSMSIDPDHDSVRALAEYALRTGAQGSFFTGDPVTSEAVQRVFDVWRGDKMSHPPVFLLSRGPREPWVRLDGLVTPARLLSEWQSLTAEGPAAQAVRAPAPTGQPHQQQITEEKS